MKKYTVIPVLACALIAIATGCKKTPTGTASKFIGTWKVTQEAYDSNNNGLIDTREVTAIDTTYTNEVLTLKSDGTGTYKLVEGGTVQDEESFKWNDDGNTLYDVTGGFKEKSDIHYLNDTQLYLGPDSLTAYPHWFIYNKQ